MYMYTCTCISCDKAILQPIYFPNCKKTRPSVRIIITCIYENRLMDKYVANIVSCPEKMHILFGIHIYTRTSNHYFIKHNK